ncbi:isoprenylcysteine carboxylmethyltransferase family protein [Hyphomicrobium methylovorum]|uniref:methyltransferase family protein n=1 Tax=Hyphomicrobium methylovorum TaxID=84 RepID=UPI0015E6EBBB|nr:isoprenylcysteine carboxylmethyltransferase family protein [Hyphomicrobium methylovorum]MBA2125247.1 isoprenylcysteine carboxylmethyltransferase family protein [Hyphomicrobium methylovorum]
MSERETLDGGATRGPTRFPWPPVLLIGAVAAAMTLTTSYPLPWPGMDDSPAHWVGLGFGALGILLAGFGIWALMRAGTTVLPDVAATHLVTSGPYVRFRNPIYLGEVLILLGTAEITKSIWFVVAGLVFAVLITVLQIIPEERHLEETFGEAYLDYKSRSRRWI